MALARVMMHPTCTQCTRVTNVGLDTTSPSIGYNLGEGLFLSSKAQKNL